MLVLSFVLDPAKCSQLSLEEKRELVHEIAQWSKDAPEILRSWSRPELLEIICAEMGKERKYTGFTKSRMIEHLLKLVSEKSETKKRDDNTTPLSAAKTLCGFKRQRKKEHPVRLVTDSDHVPLENSGEEQFKTLLCQNLACRATLTPWDAFCKRCSCCICYHFDDNKDPSLWLTCSSDPPNQDDSCGMSCHLQCALKHEGAGITKNGGYSKLDGDFYCVSCGKVNELMGSLRKQLIIAKDARRVDILCLRLSLSHKILKGTERYKEQQKILDTAVKKLKKEVGPLDQVSSKMARGIVNRLSCGAEVQKLCSSAVESIDSMFSGVNPDHTYLQGPLSCNIRFEEASPTSVVVVLEYKDKLFGDSFGCRLWHRRSTAMDYPEKPAYLVLRPQKRFVISDLDPSTEYFFRVSMFNSTREMGVWEANYITQAPNVSSNSGLYGEHGKEGDVLMVQSNSQKDSTNSSDNKLAYSDDHSKLRLLDDINKNDECHLPHNTKEDAHLMGSTSVPPSTPSKSDGTHEVPGSGGKKQNSESNYEYCVRVIRWLEREGHMEKDFRVKFLTWFSLKATMQERRVVSAFVDTLIDDPSSLADQLIDTFMDEICNEQKPVPRNSFCTRLWH
ncbi:Fibronectin [Macleaya cordata]|uniref:Fibronectin n=1 Tax=Macleaya cordata TaxID=56857 RepID=A0A200PNF6_MACCD|nr:Fibronectin [Macleaya cordata]